MTIDSVETPSQNSKIRIRDHFIDRCVPLANDVLDDMTNVTQYRSNSCVLVRIKIMRHMGYWVIRYFGPTLLMVCMSMVGLWLPVNAWPARVILTSTIMMTLITTSQNGYNEAPAYYMTAFYYWFWGMQFFIYMCVFEFAVALAWSHFTGDKLASKAARVPSPDGHYFGHNNWFGWFGKLIQACTQGIFGPVRHYEDHFNRNKVDYFARILIPSLLLIFVFAYLVSTVPAWSERYGYF